MAFVFPAYHAPDFSSPQLKNAPDAAWASVERDGVAPEGFHSTSMYPEYFKIDGQWRLAEPCSGTTVRLRWWKTATFAAATA